MGILDFIFGKSGSEKPRRKRPTNRRSDWLPNDTVFAMLKDAAAGKAQQLKGFVAQSPLQCATPDGAQLIVVRDHDARLVEGEGWTDINRPPKSGGSTRQMINLYQHSAEDGSSSWSKMPVPEARRIQAVEWDGEHFAFSTAGGTVKCTPLHLKRAVGESISGRGQSEEVIERNFGKLEGSVPLEWASKADDDDTGDREPPAPEINDEVLGTLSYDERVDWYEANIRVGGSDLSVCVSADEEGSFQPALERARQLHASLQGYAEKAKQYAVAQLLELKNDSWLGEEEEPVSPGEFAQRMTLESTVIGGDGTVTFYHNDGNLFLGHCIQITMDENDTFVDADIPG